MNGIKNLNIKGDIHFESQIRLRLTLKSCEIINKNGSELKVEENSPRVVSNGLVIFVICDSV